MPKWHLPTQPIRKWFSQRRGGEHFENTGCEQAVIKLNEMPMHYKNYQFEMSGHCIRDLNSGHPLFSAIRNLEVVVPQDHFIAALYFS